MRGGRCELPAGHRGRHTTVTFVCDGCGNTRRGTPAETSEVRLGDGSVDDVFVFCFPCAKAPTPDPPLEFLPENDIG